MLVHILTDQTRLEKIFIENRNSLDFDGFGKMV
jgi:hypothetical protein